MSSRSRAAVAVAVLLPVAVAAAGVKFWLDFTGYFAQAKCERVKLGMELAQVEAVLGGPGEECTFDEVPGVPPHAKFPDAPDGWLGVVWGDRCFRWRLGDDTIFIGIKEGRVVSKYLWVLCL